MNLIQPNGGELTEAESVQRAALLLDAFSRHTDYQHGPANPYRIWLDTQKRIETSLVVRFLNAFYPVSYHQPQLLYLCAASHDEQRHRKLILLNLIEEDGCAHPEDDPHFDLLAQLIRKLGGALDPNPDAARLAEAFCRSLGRLSPAEASGVLAGLEHPALCISGFLHRLMHLCGTPDLLETDLYLSLHARIEPLHVMWSHGAAQEFIDRGEGEAVIGAFRRAMSWWSAYWPVAFATLGYPAAPSATR